MVQNRSLGVGWAALGAYQGVLVVFLGRVKSPPRSFKNQKKNIKNHRQNGPKSGGLGGS